MSSPRQCERIEISQAAQSVMRQLPKRVRERVNLRILKLAEDPRPEDSKELIKHLNLFGVPEEGWCVQYVVENGLLSILNLEPGPCRGE